MKMSVHLKYSLELKSTSNSVFFQNPCVNIRVLDRLKTCVVCFISVVWLLSFTFWFWCFVLLLLLFYHFVSYIFLNFCRCLTEKHAWRSFYLLSSSRIFCFFLLHCFILLFMLFDVYLVFFVDLNLIFLFSCLVGNFNFIVYW